MVPTIIHSFVNIFAGGRSDSKVWLFLFYTIVIFLIYFFVSNITKPRKIAWKYFGLTLGTLYLYGLSLHIFYAHKVGVKVTDFIITGNNGEISSSTLWHTHEAKVFVGNILSHFGYTNLSTIDAGGAYLGLIPSALVYVGSILVLIVLIQSILYFCYSFGKFLADKSKRQKLFLIIGYILVSFSLIKTAIDGGIFNPAFLVGVAFILLFYRRSRGRDIKKYYYICLLASMVLVSLSLYVQVFTLSNGLIFAQIASLIILYTIVLYLTGENIRLQLLLSMTVLFLASWWLGASRDLDIYNYGQDIIAPKQDFYFYDKNTQQVTIENNTNKISIKDLVDKYQDNLSYMPITVPGITCISLSPFSAIDMTLLTKDLIASNQISNTNFVFVKYENSIKNGDYFKTQVTLNTDPCLPETLSVIDGLLRTSGINSYVILNPRFYNATDNF